GLAGLPLRAVTRAKSRANEPRRFATSITGPHGCSLSPAELWTCKVQGHGHANFWIRPVPLSVTNTFPLESTAIPKGPINSPFPEPVIPHVVSSIPPLVNLC